MARPFITLDAVRVDGHHAPFIRVALFGYTLAHYQREEVDIAFAYAYGFARAARLAGVAEPLTCWNLDFDGLDAAPDFIGAAHELADAE